MEAFPFQNVSYNWPPTPHFLVACCRFQKKDWLLCLGIFSFRYGKVSLTMNHYWGTNKCFFYISLIPKLLFHTSRFQSLLQHQCNSEQLKIQAAMWNVHMLDRTHVPRCPCRCCCCFLICRCLVCDVLNHIAFFQSFGCVYLKCLSSVSSWETCRRKSFNVKGFQSERSTMWIKGLQHERSTVQWSCWKTELLTDAWYWYCNVKGFEKAAL